MTLRTRRLDQGITIDPVQESILAIRRNQPPDGGNGLLRGLSGNKTSCLNHDLVRQHFCCFG